MVMQVEKKSDVIETWVSALIHAELNNERKPLLSQRYNVQNMDTAYKIQTEYVRWKLQQGDTISGYKAALTAEAGQKLFGAVGPGSGVLFAAGKRLSGVSLDLTDFHRPGLEVEIGYRLSAAITEPVNRNTVMSKVGEILPMVEVVDIGYADSQGQQSDIRAIDLMAGNSGSAEYIIGTFDHFDGDLNELVVSLSLDGNLLFSGQGSDAMGDQRDALVFLINQTLELNYSLQRGHYLMTGSLGRLHFAEPGSYLARYGEYGQIHFSCR